MPDIFALRWRSAIPMTNQTAPSIFPRFLFQFHVKMAKQPSGQAAARSALRLKTTKTFLFLTVDLKCKQKCCFSAPHLLAYKMSLFFRISRFKVRLSSYEHLGTPPQFLATLAFRTQNLQHSKIFWWLLRIIYCSAGCWSGALRMESRNRILLRSPLGHVTQFTVHQHYIDFCIYTGESWQALVFAIASQRKVVAVAADGRNDSSAARQLGVSQLNMLCWIGRKEECRKGSATCNRLHEQDRT